MLSHPEFNTHTSGADVIAAFPDSVAGKTFVITGPTPNGLGAQNALFLAAAKPATILLLGRSESKAASVVQEVQALSPSTTVKFVYCDLGIYSTIRSAAQTVLSLAPKIHVLINNAAIMAPAQYGVTLEGIETQFGTNHVGHFLLTNLLMPSILAAASEGARIVNLTSNGYKLGEVRFDDYNFNDGKDWTKWASYGQSKTANILFTVELAKRLEGKGVQAFAVHPGGILTTNLARELGDMDVEIAALREAFASRGVDASSDPEFAFRTVEAGTSTAFVAALDPGLKDNSGIYLANCQIFETPDYAKSPENASKLWALSEKFVGEEFPL